MARDWDLPSHGAVDLLRQAARRCAGGMNRSSGKLQAELMAVQAAPIVCFEERTPAFIGSQRFCRKNFTAEPMGMTHRLRRGSTGAALWGCCFAWVGEPKGCRGRAESPLQASMCVNLAGSSPQPGADAPAPAREWDLPSHGARTLFFRWRKKSVQKTASGTATTGKSPLLPILTAGLAMSRAMELGSFHQLLERARARLFPPSKWAGLFPFAAYRRSVPPQLAWGKLKWRCLGCFGVARMVLQHRKTDLNR